MGTPHPRKPAFVPHPSGLMSDSPHPTKPGLFSRNKPLKVTLINPPQVFSSLQVAAGVTPPLSLLYLAAYLRSCGHQPVIIDSVIEGVSNVFDLNERISCRGLHLGEIVERIPEDTDFVGITNLFSFAFPVVRDLAGKVKLALPDVPIGVGGAHPSAVPLETVMEPAIDYVVISEGEETLAHLLERLKDGRTAEDIDGLAFKDRTGRPALNPKTRFIQDLDELPFPARDLVPYEKYHRVSEAHGPAQLRWTPILSSRGCPYHCTFCTPGLWGHRYRVRSAMNVLDEMEECVSRYGIREFHFEDENLTIHKNRVMEICRGIRERELPVQWQTPNGIRASVTDRDILSAMRDAGCNHVTVAPESGSPRVLNEIISKQQNLSRVTDVVRHASSLGMKTAAYFVIGLPGETVPEVNRSIAYASQLARVGLDEVVFSNYVALPGSELYESLVRKGRFNGDWQKLVCMGDLARASSWSEHISSENLKTLRRKAYLTFHLTKTLSHPLKVVRSLLNVFRGREELKTERTLITLIHRLGLKKRRSEPRYQDAPGLSQETHARSGFQSESGNARIPPIHQEVTT